MKLHADDFIRELRSMLQQAEDAGFVAVDVNAGRFYRRLRPYPEPHDRMTVCCDILRQEMTAGDSVVYEASPDQRARLTIRYKLPRSA